MDTPRIVVVDDEPDFLQDLVDFLSIQGFSVTGVEDGEGLISILAERNVDLVVLDLLLPDTDGLEIAGRIRKTSNMGILVLSNLSEAETQVAALKLGADAYLTKNSDLFVIDATVRSILRRLKNEKLSLDKLTKHNNSDWLLDASSWTLSAPNQSTVELNAAERAIVALLLQKPGESVDRLTMLGVIGKADTAENLRYLDVVIQRLRKKIQQHCGMKVPIKGLYGKGYVFINKP